MVGISTDKSILKVLNRKQIQQIVDVVGVKTLEEISQVQHPNENKPFDKNIAELEGQHLDIMLTAISQVTGWKYMRVLGFASDLGKRLLILNKSR